jgi:DedD protein
VKERLTGAIILVVLIVLLVPELLSGPKGPSAPVPAGATPTPSEEPPLRSYTINLGDDSHSRPESADTSGPAMPQPSGPDQSTAQSGAPTPDASKAQSEPSVAGSSPATSSESQPPGAPQASETPQATGSTTESSQAPKSQSSGTSQATGSSQASSARQASGAQAARPGEAAVPAQRTVKSTAPAQKPTPPPSAAAPRSESPKPARAAATLEKPTKAHPAATTSAAASTSESGWAVQLGVFASHENAERLALEVRVKGFKASVSPVTSGGRKLYRVRVGPTADRAAAQELQGRLKAAGRPGGTVVPYS